MSFFQWFYVAVKVNIIPALRVGIKISAPDRTVIEPNNGNFEAIE
jgi:hypothetical protein